EQLWKELHEALKDQMWKAFGIFQEGYFLFRKAAESFDAGAIEGSVLLCRATLESSFLIFLSVQWGSDSSFAIVYPTTLDGKLRFVGFDELRDAVVQRVSFSEEQITAIDRIHQNGNFVAHFASRRIKQRMARVERFKKWEAQNENATESDRIKAVDKLLDSEKSWISTVEALQNLDDTRSILLTLGKATGSKHSQSRL
ncbi:MAG TPA: hypothetical protein VGS11_05185, partial [Candidatus Bathyarchaeia archaeon]|nr:hypothetical protein [Candidatus Bathyarchaeia archaeon]